MKLSKQAIQVLEELRSGPKTVDDMESEGYDQAMVNRAALELEEAGLVEIDESEEVELILTETGEQVREEGSPEYRLVDTVQEEGRTPVSELEGINVDAALGKGRERNWIEIDDGDVVLTSKGEDVDVDPVRQRIETEDYGEELEERGLVEAVTRTEKVLELTEKGRDVDTGDIEEDFNVEARVKTPRSGKKHFYKQIMGYAREVWLEMGFEEMSGDFVVPGFLCFDALYTPQDHPARDLQDTFFVDSPGKSDLSGYGEKVENVRETHENGWTTGSTGWNYEWSLEDAEKNVLRTHTTAVSARKLSELDEDDLPKKFFILGRSFRNETVDRHHLAEFYQTDGIVVGKDLNFRHLKGYISEFFRKMGYDEFRLIPSYYPYTEMSVEVQVWDEDLDEWIGLGGAGMFRPEVVKPMLGFEATVLAWGLGIPRIAMKAAEIEDIRELYRNDIELLEQTPVWRPDTDA